MKEELMITISDVVMMNKESFFRYLKDGNLTIESDYIDATGTISNGKKFKCNYAGFMVGTSGIVKEFSNLIELKGGIK